MEMKLSTEGKGKRLKAIVFYGMVGLLITSTVFLDFCNMNQISTLYLSPMLIKI